MPLNKEKIIVTIDRSEAYRRYQLRVRNDDGSFTDVGGPLSPKDFAKTHGFNCEWPHEDVKQDNES